MSVLIKGMEMPQGSCEWIDKDHHLHRCKLLNGDDDCKMQEGICADATWEEQFANCPLVSVPTSHGRLIDADALIKKTRKQYCDDCDRRKGIKKRRKQFIYEIGDAPCRACWMDDLVSELADALTIIEAEGREDE